MTLILKFFGTAEVWTVNNKPRFVNVWTLVMDAGQEGDEMFCLSEQGRLTAQESLNGVDGEVRGGASWRYVQSFTFDSAGNRRRFSSRFVSVDGVAVAPPKLSREDAEAAKAASDTSLANEVIAALSR